MADITKIDIKIPSDRGLLLVRSGLISREQLTNTDNDGNIVLNTTIPIVKRINRLSSIIIKKNNTWQMIKDNDYDSIIIKKNNTWQKNETNEHDSENDDSLENENNNIPHRKYYSYNNSLPKNSESDDSLENENNNIPHRKYYKKNK